MSSNSMLKILFLDDSPERADRFLDTHVEALWVTTAKECIQMLHKKWDEIYLDHDLGGEVFVDSLRTDCGMEVVRFIESNPQEHLMETVFTIHSHNYEAALEMVGRLNDAGYDASWSPFSN